MCPLCDMDLIGPQSADDSRQMLIPGRVPGERDAFVTLTHEDGSDSRLHSSRVPRRGIVPSFDATQCRLPVSR